MITYKYVAPVAEKHLVRIYRHDGEGWLIGKIFGSAPSPVLRDYVTIHNGKIVSFDFNGSGNGCCDPEDEYAEFQFLSQSDSEDFINWFKGSFEKKV